ncbi:hypothetical protein HHI36_019907 [Cryptolaemus montrouzieri]|uniref:Prolactin receptor n=1 Tax=Cryptolaemus montrouzieri TaxID=559131 RepID=A0ABD2N925_9CUCU
MEKNRLAPDRIHNMDEPGMTTSIQGKSKVIAPKSVKQIGQIVSAPEPELQLGCSHEDHNIPEDVTLGQNYPGHLISQPENVTPEHSPRDEKMLIIEISLQE